MTAIPTVGQVVSQGQMLYQMSGAPVVLLYGSTPAYRTLSPGVIGADVAELNADLVDLGDATSTELPSGTAEFTYWTEVSVKKLGGRPRRETVPSTLSLGQAVYAPDRGPGDLGCRPPWVRQLSRASRCWLRHPRHAKSASPWTRPSSPKWRSATR